ncbi:MAG: HD-GYP domain-containing protein, partial [Bacillota bacterium]|nr:HD-GYP domain-containing protein [Bacillota bacterium]
RQVVKRIQDRYSEELINAIQISISFGWDTRVSPTEDIVTIMKNAEDNMYRSKTLESQSIRGNFIKTIINTLHEKNPREEQHSKRVSDLAMRLGIAMGLSDEMQGKLHGVGLLHDIGKIAIDQSILNKPGGLTQQEWSEMKRHPEIGYRIIGSSYERQEFDEYILSHHEKWDGSGYPQGLAGEDIPTISRIITLADAYDAMTGQRTYKKTLTEDESVAEILKHSGTQFDPSISRIFVEKVLGRVWQ